MESRSADPYDEETDYEEEDEGAAGKSKKVVTLVEPTVPSSVETEAEGEDRVGHQDILVEDPTVEDQSPGDGGKKKDGAEVDPTVAYDMDTDEELEGEDPMIGLKKDTADVQPTVAYEMETDEDVERERSETDGNERKKEKMAGVEATVAYNLESDDDLEGEVHKKEDVAAVDPTVAYNMETDEENEETEDVIIRTPKKKSGPFIDSDQTDLEEEGSVSIEKTSTVSDPVGEGISSRCYLSHS